MENFVLNLFSDQLSKVILNFHPSTINANFLSGKGSITNLRLNVDVINEFLNKPPHGTVPFVKFTEIRLSELRVEVTSYTNLKKAPIVLVIEEIHAAAVEPLEYHLDPTKAPPSTPTAATTQQQQQQSNQQPRQQYGLLHRILDNLCIKINRIHLTFQTLGKFKTLRRGPWTPPPVSVTLENVEWISVTEAGNAGTPDQIWAHNELFAQQNRFRQGNNSNSAPQHRSYIIYKRLSGVCHVRLSAEAHYTHTQQPRNKCNNNKEDLENLASLISNTQIDVHVAYIRRLRDAGVTGVDVDVLCHDMDINLDISSSSLSGPGNNNSASYSSGCDVGSFVHMMIGLLHCYYKDRTFSDPLLPDGVRDETKQSISIEEAQSEKGNATEESNRNGATENDGEEEVGPDDFMLPEIAVMDDEESSQSDYEEEPDEEHDEAFLEWKRRYDEQKDGAKRVDSVGSTDDTNALSSTTQSDTVQKEKDTTKLIETDDDKEKKVYKRKRKAVIVIASGAQKFEKLSFSLSLSRVNMKLFLPSHTSTQTIKESTQERHCLELLVEGLVAECIWPKVTGEIGGHLQCSFAYLHIIDLLQRLSENANGTDTNSWSAVKIFPLLKIGERFFQGHDIFSVPKHLKNGWSNKDSGGADKCDEFPMMESRQTTWTWDRPRRGKRAFGLKSTISFVDEKLSRWSKTSVNHEACMGDAIVLMDSTPIANIVNVFTNQHFLFDSRWMSGDWTADICSDIVVTESFHLKDHLQPLPAIYSQSSSTTSSFPSSELRSVTAHLSSINVRIPNPDAGISSFGMADIICGISEATIIVSSDLPKSFLSGKITASENGNPDFPNDPSDISCVSESPQGSMNSETCTKFRAQVSLTNLLVDLVPMHQSLHPSESKPKGLIAPTNVTSMISLEQNGAAKQSVVVSILLQELECNVNLRLLCGALQTFKYHASNFMISPNATTNGTTALAENNVSEKDKSVVVCVHVPDITLQCWGEDSHLQSELLFQAKAKRFELGSESMICKGQCSTVTKVGIDCISVETCSGSDNMMELLSIGNQTSQLISMGQRAAKACSLSTREDEPRDCAGILLRVENCHENDMPAMSCAIDTSSPLTVSFSFNALEVFLRKVVDALSLPVLEHNASMSIGSSIFSSIHHMCSIFAVSQVDSEIPISEEEMARHTLMRCLFSEVLLLVEVSDEKSYLIWLNDIEIASGQYDKITSLAADSVKENLLVCKSCGHNQTWLDAYHLLDEDTKKVRSDTFYAMKLQHTVVNVGTEEDFHIVIPTDVVDYRFPVPKGESSKTSSIDVKSMKKMMRHCMNVGKSFSSSYYKLYMMFYTSSLSSDISPTAVRLHALISNYHVKMQTAVRNITAEVNSLREGMFLKERERIGALAMALSSASGWVRVGEDSSFSQTRLFTSATFWRYWMVLDKSVIILYKAPGCTAPSFIIPLHNHTQLRTISMSSSSNKNSTGIVGNHLRQRGFALFDDLEGMELFFVASNQTEHEMFVSAIGRVLQFMQIDPALNDASTENGTVLEAVPPVEVESGVGSIDATEAGNSEDPFSIDVAVTNVGIAEESNFDLVEETEGEGVETDVMETIELDANGVSTTEKQTIKTQLPKEEEKSSSQRSASLPMRERLALAKGKSKLATSKFGSALKNAKQAASEMSREEIKQRGSERMAVLKRSANTAAVLGKSNLVQATTAIRSSMHEQSIHAKSSDSVDSSSSSKFEKVNKSISTVNKSMSSAMQRLHIDENLTRISTAVKHVRSESQVIRQLSSSEISRRKIGISDEQLNKPIKFDGRETFSTISGHPSKVKSVASGEPFDIGQLCTQAELQKISGSWLVSVTSILSHDATENNEAENLPAEASHLMKYEITLTDVSSSQVEKCSVERSKSELMVFYVTISEILAKSTPCVLDQSGVGDEDHSSRTLQISPFERLRVAGSLLQRIVEGNATSRSLSSLRDLHCEWIKLFSTTILESYLPEEAIKATVSFFGLDQRDSIATTKYGGSLPSTNGDDCTSTIANDAFNTFSEAVTGQNLSTQYTLVPPAHTNRVGSHLIDTIMAAYTEATSERDAALASLSVSSILNDHHIMQEQLARKKSGHRTQSGGMSKQGSLHSHSGTDQEMLALCKQLGGEIAARTNAEMEINRLKEQLELERKIARANEADLLDQLSKK